jgi:hypothetical protein
MRTKIIEIVEHQGHGASWCYVLAERVDTRKSVVVAKHYISESMNQGDIAYQLQTTYQQMCCIDQSSIFFENHEQAIEEFERSFDADE